MITKYSRGPEIIKEKFIFLATGYTRLMILLLPEHVAVASFIFNLRWELQIVSNNNKHVRTT